MKKIQKPTLTGEIEAGDQKTWKGEK